MTLSVHEKAIIAELFEEDKANSTDVNYTIKDMMLRAYFLLQGQNKNSIRESIASHYARRMVTLLKVADKKSFANLHDFFTYSILMSDKKYKNIAQQILLQLKLMKRASILIIDIGYINILKSEIKRIFAKRIEDERIVEKAFSSNMENLKRWIRDYPHEFFNKEKEDYFKRYRSYYGIGRDVLEIIILIMPLQLIFAREKNDNITPMSFIYAVAALLLWKIVGAFTYTYFTHTDPIETLNDNVSFDLMSIEEYCETNEAILMQDKEWKEAKRSQPMLSMVVDSNKPDVWQNQYDEAPPSTKVIKPIKRKLPANTIVEIKNEVSAIEEKALEIPDLRPDFFGKRFATLSSIHIVPLKKRNQKHNSSYFAIWDNLSITANVKNTGKSSAIDKLFEVFKKGKIVGNEGASGIKYLKDLSYFEVKEVTIADRVYGEEEIKENNKTALVFSHYRPKGFH